MIRSFYFRLFALSVLAITATLNFISIDKLLDKNSHDSQVLGQTAEVTTTASVFGCLVNITVYPEERIPPTDNWGTDINVRIYDSSDDNFEGQFTATTNNQGEATVNICDLGMFLPPDQYDFYIYGLSHLTKRFPDVYTFDQVNNDLDFSYDELEAGETGNIRDEEINSLDLSTQVNAIGSADNVNDLNQDGIVNAADIAITISNIYMLGDKP